jgi:histidinol-phosphatase (PHP family)
VMALKKIHRLNIPITLSSDAHRPEELSGHFTQAIGILKEIGFRHLMLFNGKGWVAESLD